MSLRSTKEYTDDFENTSILNQSRSNLNKSLSSRRNETINNREDDVKAVGLSSNELRNKLVQIVKNKGIYDLMKVNLNI